MVDGELQVEIVPDEQALENIENREIGVDSQQNNQLRPSAAEQQEGIVAGGVSKGIVAAGIFGGILSQLKSVTGIISAVLGTISRALIPTVELLADLLRPVVQEIDKFLSTPSKAVETFNSNIQNPEVLGQIAGRSIGNLPQLGPLSSTFTGEIGGIASGLASEFIEPPSPDQSGEAKKQQQANKNSDILSDLLGGF